MGHLDPFLQDLNGIGIIAMMVGISAVIVRVVFCKTMRDRIYTGVGGLISAIVMSLGIDYAIRPFAGTGESTATNGLGFVQLMIGVVIALIGGAVLRGILSLDDGEPQPTSNSLIMDTQTELNRLAPRYGLVAAMSNEDSYYGWFVIDHDNGGSPDPLYEASLNANLQQERQLGKLYGDPGSGLDYSAFGNTAVQAGQQGESALARIIAYMRLNVISFWSLYGLNENRQPINADIDCVLVGIDPQQQVHAWFVDAKNYKGGSDTYEIEPLSEFLACQLAEQICPQAVHYDLGFYHQKLISKCRLFTDEAHGLAKISDFPDRPNSISGLLKLYEKFGAEDVLRRMFVLDALILNTDRHLGNFGFLFDNQTMEVKTAAPMFDHNRSLLFDLDEDQLVKPEWYVGKCRPRIGVDFIKTAHGVLTDEIRQELKNLDGFRFRPHSTIELPEERLEALSDVVEGQRLKILETGYSY